MPIANAAENFKLIYPYLAAGDNAGGKFVSDNLSVTIKDSRAIDHFGNKIYSLLFKEDDEDILSMHFAIDASRHNLIPLEYNNMLSQQQCSAFDFTTGLITSERTLIKLDSYLNDCLKTIAARFPISGAELIDNVKITK